jgi:hypothetical protein
MTPFDGDSKLAGKPEFHLVVNDYGAWLHACDSFELSFKSIYTEHKSTRYDDETVQRIRGLTARANDLALPANFTTRSDEWRIEPRKAELAKEDVSPPWTRFNNCAPIDFIEFIDASMEVEAQGFSENQKCKEKSGVREKPRSGMLEKRTDKAMKTDQLHTRTTGISASHGNRQFQGGRQ